MQYREQIGSPAMIVSRHFVFTNSSSNTVGIRCSSLTTWDRGQCWRIPGPVRTGI